MANPFDAFDPKAGTNPFDQFDGPAPAKADPSLLEPMTWAEKLAASLPSSWGLANVRGSAVGRVAQGLADPGVAVAQAATNAVSPLLAESGNQTLAQRVNQGIAQHEQQYQADRGAAGSGGFDPLRLVGNAAMTLPLGGVAGTAETLGAMAGRGAAQGGLFAALEPVTNGGESYWKDKAKQTAIGAAGGAVVAPVVGGVARMIQPNVRPNVAALQSEDVTMTPGQILGGAVNRMEEKAQSIPFLGDAITAARKRGDLSFQKAAIDRAAAPIGADIRGTGYDAIAELSDKIGQAYDKVLPQTAVNVLDPAFVNKMSNLRSMVQNLPAQEAQQFDNIIAREIDQRIAPNGVLSGQNLKDAWAALRDAGQKFSKSPDAYQADLGSAIKQAFNELKTQVETTNPAAVVSELKNADLAYANFKRLQRAASSIGANEGNFSPAQLNAAVKAADWSKDKAQFAKGDALMQDLSRAGKDVLTTKYPDSGTAGRWILGSLLTGGSAVAPGVTLPLAAGVGLGAASYTPMVQNALAALLTKRPANAPAVANYLRKMSPAIMAATVPALLQRGQQ